MTETATVPRLQSPGLNRLGALSLDGKVKFPPSLYIQSLECKDPVLWLSLRVTLPGMEMYYEAITIWFNLNARNETIKPGRQK